MEQASRRGGNADDRYGSFIARAEPKATSFQVGCQEWYLDFRVHGVSDYSKGKNW